MKWMVTYRPDAADDLATIWLDAPDRQAIADAANAIDRQLSINPLTEGESREGNSRIVFEVRWRCFSTSMSKIGPSPFGVSSTVSNAPAFSYDSQCKLMPPKPLIRSGE